MKITAAQIKKVREETGAPLVNVKKRLEEFDGNEQKAIEVLKKEGFEKMAKRTDRATSAGLIISYVHHTGKIACLIEMLCETDFVAKNELFIELANNVALQVVSMNPKDEKELLGQEFIKDTSKKIEDLIKEVKNKTGENINLGRFTRMELGV